MDPHVALTDTFFKGADSGGGSSARSTTFEYRNLKVAPTEAGYAVTFDVKNAGSQGRRRAADLRGRN